MPVELLTKQDLQQFKLELVHEIKQLLIDKPEQKKWLRSYEVKKLLNVSPGTLQNMRINGTLRPKKVGGIHFYDYDEIHQLLSSNPKTNLR